MRHAQLLGALFLSTLTASAQWLEIGNTGTIYSSDFLGTLDQERLTLRTFNNFRLVVNEDDVYNIGAFATRPAHGFIGISPTDDFWDDGPGPFSRLHLAEGSGDNTQSLGYRPWMRNGVQFTGNADQGYVGQKYTYADPGDHTSAEREDTTDMIIQWSDNPGKARKDRMRFIFTSGYDEATSGAGSLEGLEGMRLFPENEDEVNVGIGDFFAGNIDDPVNVIEPTERLDVLTGSVRIRELPTESPTEDEKFVVVDDTGVLHWRPIDNLPDNCEWTLENIGVSGSATEHDVYTATGTSDDCPDKTDQVGIGITDPAAKLHVYSNPATDGTSLLTGVSVDLRTPTTDSYIGLTSNIEPHTGNAHSQAGMVGVARNATLLNIGTRGRSYITNSGITTSTACGLRGESEVHDGTVGESIGCYGSSVRSGGTVSYGYGLYGMAANGNSANGVYGVASGATANAGATGVAVGSGTTNYGVYATANTATNNYALYATVPDSSGNKWAGWFNGRVKVVGNGHVTGTWSVASDGQFKTNVEDIEGATAVVAALHPKSYDFIPSEHPALAFPSGQQLGLIAQEVEEVLPQLVRTEIAPAQYDSLGIQTHGVVEYKSLNYIGLIPVLIAAMQEQQDRIEQLEGALADCCSINGGERSAVQEGIGMDVVTGNERALTIQPNPFNERATLYYTLERGGRMQLMANSADGKQLRVLQEAYLEAGQYQHEWQTSELSPGIYYVTLLLDGEPIVKKAVKVQR